MNLKKIILNMGQETSHMNNNEFIIETWKRLGLESRMGGVAFSELKHFMKNTADIETITRYRRLKWTVRK